MIVHIQLSKSIHDRLDPFITVGADIAGKTVGGIAAAHHLFDHFMDVGPLVGRNLFPVIILPPFPMVDEDLAEAVGAVFRWRK